MSNSAQSGGQLPSSPILALGFQIRLRPLPHFAMQAPRAFGEFLGLRNDYNALRFTQDQQFISRRRRQSFPARLWDHNLLRTAQGDCTGHTCPPLNRSAADGHRVRPITAIPLRSMIASPLHVRSCAPWGLGEAPGDQVLLRDATRFTNRHWPN
jgi:hypothetical protein